MTSRGRISAFISITPLLLFLFLIVSPSPCLGQLPAVTLRAAGSSLPYPLLVQGKSDQPGWFDLFKNTSKGLVSTIFNQTGSGDGINLILGRGIDFAVSDAPLDDSQRSQLRASLIHMPLTLAAIDLAYNIPASGISGQLNLTASIVARILQRNITRWDDPMLKEVNPGLTYGGSIAPVVRSGGTGTTFVMSRYLSSATPDWILGVGMQLAWPSGVVQSTSNAALMNSIAYTPGAIGYINYGTANLAGVATARLRNTRNQWVTPTLASITAATRRIQDKPLPSGIDSWWNVDLTDQDVDGAWPIVTFTYILAYQDLSNYGPTASAMVGLFTYINLEKVQAIASEFGLVPLPSWVRYANANSLDEIVLPDGYNRTAYFDPSPPAPPKHKSAMGSFSIILTIGLFIFLIAVITYELYIAKRWRQ